MKWHSLYFDMGGERWAVSPVPRSSIELIDRAGKRTVATTDPRSRTVFIADDLEQEFAIRVFIHELGHAAMVSFGLLDDIARMARPEFRIELEEFICNLIADHGGAIFRALYETMGLGALELLPGEIEKLVA